MAKRSESFDNGVFFDGKTIIFEAKRTFSIARLAISRLFWDIQVSVISYHHLCCVILSHFSYPVHVQQSTFSLSYCRLCWIIPTCVELSKSRLSYPRLCLSIRLVWTCDDLSLKPYPSRKPSCITSLKCMMPTRRAELVLILKGLSYEIDFENVDENLQILALTRASAGFRIFQRHLWFLVKIKPLLSGKC